MPDGTPAVSGGPEAAGSRLIRSLRTAVVAAHLAELLLDAGHGDAAIVEAAFALSHAPGNAQARALTARAMGGPVGSTGRPPTAAGTPGTRTRTTWRLPRTRPTYRAG
ncbi:hypothetical protein ACFWNQ_35435 [Streptomyces virginiae]|uniref:hypothetical protein n=1 Tax=Streptomyces virginiae TaxID=1961 RepID=UPI00364C0188